MKIQVRILLILVSGLIACILLSFLLKMMVTAKRKDLLAEQFRRTQTVTVPNALEINIAELKSCTYDYSVWDQLVDFVYKKDTSWARQELEIALLNHPFDYVSVLDKEGKKIYFVSKDKTDSSVQFTLPEKKLLARLKEDPFLHFYFRDNNQLIEVQSGPIQPTSDAERVTAPHGYLLIARTVNEEFIKRLQKIAPEIGFSLVPGNTTVQEYIDNEHSAIRYGLPLKDLDNRLLGTIAISRSYNDLNAFNKGISSYLAALIIIVCAFGIIFFIAMKKLVLTPIGAISTALHTKNPHGIRFLSQSKTEYGQLSRLVIESFSQQAILENEVETRKKSEQALKDALMEKEEALREKFNAERAAQAKSQFLSTMSHEIRTPINGVIGIAHLLMEEELSEKQQEYIHTLNYSAQHLLSLVSDILDFSKIEAGSLHFENAPFNLEKLCRNAFNLLGNKAKEKNIRYRFEPDHMNGYTLSGDATRLSQVITNLLSNALKFTEKGEVVFGYTILRHTDQQITIRFSVRDTGIGIPSDKNDRVFDSFEQADDSVTRRYGGTGLGLTISKKIVELQGGQMQVHSEEGRGSEFCFTLSFNRPEKKTAPLTHPRQEATTADVLPGLRILVAEDNPVNALVLTRFLQKWKTECRVANNGAAALQMLQENEYDIVLMDLQMPVMGGAEATRLIRQSDNPRIREIKVVAFTADALLETRQKLLENGFNHCITKPFNPEHLYKYLASQYQTVS